MRWGLAFWFITGEFISGGARLAVVCLLASSVIWAGHTSAHADFLSGRACTQLEDEQRGLIANGAQADFARDPSTVATMSVERQERLVRLLEIRATLKFRCTTNASLRPPYLGALPVRRPATALRSLPGLLRQRKKLTSSAAPLNCVGWTGSLPIWLLQASRQVESTSVAKLAGCGQLGVGNTFSARTRPTGQRGCRRMPAVRLTDWPSDW